MSTRLTIRYDERTWAPDVSGALFDENGEPIYSHVSSSKTWLEQDLTRNFGRSTELAQRYPDGFSVEWQAICSAPQCRCGAEMVNDGTDWTCPTMQTELHALIEHAVAKMRAAHVERGSNERS